MKVALVQDALYLPSWGGANKSNRLLAQGLAQAGHDVVALTRTLNQGSHTQTWDALTRTLQGFGVQPRGDASAYDYTHRGVRVMARRLRGPEGPRALREIAHQADRLVLSASLPTPLLRQALAAAPDRVVFVAHTVFNLPAGPASARPDAQAAALLTRGRVLTVSRFAADTIQTHLGCPASVVRFPVYAGLGHGVSEPGDRVLCINPCALKGLPILLAMADAQPERGFAAVPTWGADVQVLEALRARPNIELIPPDPQIDRVLRRARVLVVPSVVPETLGLVVIEAMLCGVPVICSDLGGLPEAALGVARVVPVTPAERVAGAWRFPAQDAAPWLTELAALDDPAAWRQRSERGRRAARRFVQDATVERFVEALL